MRAHILRGAGRGETLARHTLAALADPANRPALLAWLIEVGIGTEATVDGHRVVVIEGEP